MQFSKSYDIDFILWIHHSFMFSIKKKKNIKKSWHYFYYNINFFFFFTLGDIYFLKKKDLLKLQKQFKTV
jgi:hypothetical protein